MPLEFTNQTDAIGHTANKIAAVISIGTEAGDATTYEVLSDAWVYQDYRYEWTVDDYEPWTYLVSSFECNEDEWIEVEVAWPTVVGPGDHVVHEYRLSVAAYYMYQVARSEIEHSVPAYITLGADGGIGFELDYSTETPFFSLIQKRDMDHLLVGATIAAEYTPTAP